jgi:lysophosphatidate acyltransferase
MLDELYALTEKARGQKLPRPQDDATNGAAKTTGSDARVAA